MAVWQSFNLAVDKSNISIGGQYFTFVRQLTWYGVWYHLETSTQPHPCLHNHCFILIRLSPLTHINHSTSKWTSFLTKHIICPQLLRLSVSVPKSPPDTWNRDRQMQSKVTFISNEHKTPEYLSANLSKTLHTWWEMRSYHPPFKNTTSERNESDRTRKTLGVWKNAATGQQWWLWVC